MKHWAWLALAGAIITTAGIVGGVWLQVDAPFGSFGGHNAAYRWQLAMLALSVVAGGLIVFAIAQVLRSMSERTRTD
jgi:hypothetical protein